MEMSVNTFNTSYIFDFNSVFVMASMPQYHLAFLTFTRHLTNELHKVLIHISFYAKQTILLFNTALCTLVYFECIDFYKVFYISVL